MSVIFSRAPLRVSLGGGGTDIPSYYREHGGFLVSGAIDKYVYMLTHTVFQRRYRMKYSQFEEVDDPSEIRHPILRESLLRHWNGDPLEVSVIADVPAGTGLGSSGSFTVGLLRALHAYRQDHLSTQALAEAACHIEIERLGDPVGKQDQYIAAFGGLTRFEFAPDGSVEVERLSVAEETLADLEEHLLLFFTGYSRRATTILADQKQRSEQDDEAMIANLDEVSDLGRRIAVALEAGDTAAFAGLMHEHWLAKRQRTKGITSDEIDGWYDLARRNGALGGKLVGAGAGGFLLFYADSPRQVRRAMADAGLSEVRFGFDHDGSVVLARS